jgi:hypothetical protein
VKKIKVRIALVANARGKWAARGWHSEMSPANYKRAAFRDAELDCGSTIVPRHRYWIEVEVEVPSDEPITVQAAALKV